ncbi:MAG: PAS domain-containing sensor histidine kinase [Actinobacteria bacterium]|nr:PAS domain-containing sensor histidine kinase [Actinomycetota bacterium]
MRLRHDDACDGCPKYAKADVAAAKVPHESHPDQFEEFFRRHDAVFLLMDGATGRLLDANDAALRFYGYSLPQIRSMKIGDINQLPPDELDAERQRAVVEERKYFVVPHRLASGEMRTVEVHTTPVVVGDKTCLFSVIHDITERVKADAQVRFLGSVADNVAEGVHVTRAADGKILYANPAMESMFGYGPGELVGQDVAVLNAPTERRPEETAAEIIGCIEATGTWRGEILNVRKDGTQFWCNASVSTLETPDHGTTWTSVHTDITERKAVEKALRESEERFRAIASNSPDHVLMQDSDLRYVFVLNPQLGLTQEDMIGRTDYDFLSREEADRLTEVKTRVLKTGQPAHLQISLVSKAGREEFLDGTLVPRVDVDGRVTGLTGYFRNVTELRAAEAQLARRRDDLETLVQQRTEQLVHANTDLEQANEALTKATSVKDDFLANMSHELRTPLNSIIGFSGVLSQELAGSLNEEQRRQVGMINNSGRHLLELVNEVLDLVKIESAQNEPVITDVDVCGLGREMLDMIRPIAEAKGIETRLTCPDGVVPVPADEGYVRRILLSLLENAVKFTEHGHVGVAVSQDASGVTVAVEDSGCGIPAEDLERVFDDFYQGTPDGGGKSDGTGLGLTISRRLAASMGARIEVTSEPGRGSVFTLRIPVQSR